MVGEYINLLQSLPKSKRDIKARQLAKTPENVNLAKQFGYEYFDGDRSTGYGGYKYDGRWQSVAKDIIEFFKLPKYSRILDVGCAKGFLVKDFVVEKMDAYGVDVSRYALLNSMAEVEHRLYLCNKDSLHYADKHFDLVISINTIHNLPPTNAIKMLKEIERVSKNAYIVVDSYNTPEEKEIFESWVLTAETHGYPWEWKRLFEEAGYRGHYSWTIL